MKTNKIQMIATVVVAAILSFTLFAQGKEIVKFDVNGLYIASQKYTRAQIVEQLGDPSYYYAPIENDDVFEYFKYDKSRFTFTNGELIEFVVTDGCFKLFGGLLRVGDKLSVVESLPGCRFVLKSDQVFEGITYSELWTDYSERPVSIGHKNGIVVSVSYSEPN